MSDQQRLVAIRAALSFLGTLGLQVLQGQPFNFETIRISAICSLLASLALGFFLGELRFPWRK